MESSSVVEASDTDCGGGDAAGNNNNRGVDPPMMAAAAAIMNQPPRTPRTPVQQSGAYSSLPKTPKTPKKILKRSNGTPPESYHYHHHPPTTPHRSSKSSSSTGTTPHKKVRTPKQVLLMEDSQRLLSSSSQEDEEEEGTYRLPSSLRREFRVNPRLLKRRPRGRRLATDVRGDGLNFPQNDTRRSLTASVGVTSSLIGRGSEAKKSLVVAPARFSDSSAEEEASVAPTPPPSRRMSSSAEKAPHHRRKRSVQIAAAAAADSETDEPCCRPGPSSAPPPIPPKGHHGAAATKKRKRGSGGAGMTTGKSPLAKKQITLESEEEVDRQAATTGGMEDEEDDEGGPSTPLEPLKETQDLEDQDFTSELVEDPVTYGSQKAMGFVVRICEALDLRWQGCTITPGDAIWAKIGGTFMRKKHPEFRLTFSSFDSFHCQIGRFVAAMIYGLAGLEPRFVPGGAHVWRHGWKGANVPKCLHGSPMAIKPRTVELNPTSEAGKRAIAEQGGVIERNRFGRQVVVLRFDNNAVCAKDKDHSGFPYPHATGSCAMSFSDAQKALSAMKHDLMWTMALYPNADRSRIEQCVLISTHCNCNYANESPVSGRQTCRMTPYKLSGIEDITPEMAESRSDMKAHLKYPHTMVYTCCNPQAPGGNPIGGGGRGPKRNEKSCSWRLSYMDLRFAYAYASEIMVTLFGTEAPTHVPEFRWNDKYSYKTEVIAPVNPLTSSDPFA